MDETLFKIDGRWRYAFRAIDEHGQIVDVLLSDHRDTTAATEFFARAMASSEVTPSRDTTDKAKCYPPALRVAVPTAEHRSFHYLNNDLERDHQHVKGRVRPMRRFKQTATAGTFCQGHALIRTLGQGFSDLTAGVSPRLRLATAWPVLTAAI